MVPEVGSGRRDPFDNDDAAVRRPWSAFDALCQAASERRKRAADVNGSPFEPADVVCPARQARSCDITGAPDWTNTVGDENISTGQRVTTRSVGAAVEDPEPNHTVWDEGDRLHRRRYSYGSEDRGRGWQPFVGTDTSHDAVTTHRHAVNVTDGAGFDVGGDSERRSGADERQLLHDSSALVTDRERNALRGSEDRDRRWQQSHGGDVLQGAATTFHQAVDVTGGVGLDVGGGARKQLRTDEWRPPEPVPVTDNRQRALRSEDRGRGWQPFDGADAWYGAVTAYRHAVDVADDAGFDASGDSGRRSGVDEMRLIHGRSALVTDHGRRVAVEWEDRDRMGRQHVGADALSGAATIHRTTVDVTGGVEFDVDGKYRRWPRADEEVLRRHRSSPVTQRATRGGPTIWSSTKSGRNTVDVTEGYFVPREVNQQMLGRQIDASPQNWRPADEHRTRTGPMSVVGGHEVYCRQPSRGLGARETVTSLHNGDEPIVNLADEANYGIRNYPRTEHQSTRVFHGQHEVPGRKNAEHAHRDGLYRGDGGFPSQHGNERGMSGVATDHSAPRPRGTDDNAAPTSQKKNVMKPQQYDGKDSINSFLAHFEVCARFNNWGDNEKCSWMQWCLKGRAQQVLWDLPPDHLTSYQSVVNTLKERFGSIHQNELYRIELRNRRRRRDENMSDLMQDIRRLMVLAYTSTPSEMWESIAVDSYLTALNDPHLALEIRKRGPTTLEMAYRESLLLEGFMKASGTVNEVRDRSRMITVVDSPTNDDEIEGLKLEFTMLQQEIQRQLRKQSEVLDAQNQQLLQRIESLRSAEALPTQRLPSQTNQRCTGRLGHGSRRTRLCYNCRQPGHHARDCSGRHAQPKFADQTQHNATEDIVANRRIQVSSNCFRQSASRPNTHRKNPDNRKSTDATSPLTMTRVSAYDQAAEVAAKSTYVNNGPELLLEGRSPTKLESVEVMPIKIIKRPGEVTSENGEHTRREGTFRKLETVQQDFSDAESDLLSSSWNIAKTLRGLICVICFVCVFFLLHEFAYCVFTFVFAWMRFVLVADWVSSGSLHLCGQVILNLVRILFRHYFVLQLLCPGADCSW